MRFWGWGEDGHDAPLPPPGLAWLEARLGGGPLPETPRAARTVADVRLEPSRLGAAARAALEGAAGAHAVRDDAPARVLHAAGKSYPDLLRMRAGDGAGAPDAVVIPGSHREVRAVLAACAAGGVAVVPFGGGTSVVGGVEPLRGPFAAVVSLDLAGLATVEAVDEISRVVVAGAGLRVAALEEQLSERGLALGHVPQSFEHVTVGGCAATRSAGQASTGVGRFEDLVAGLRCAAPAGDVDVPVMPASAAGPSLRELVVGSEGTLGVLTSVALRVRRAPAARRFEGVVLADLASGLAAFRALAQERAAPDVARLSDEAETEMSFALAAVGGMGGAALRGWLRARGVTGGCLAVLGWEDGSDAAVRARREATLRVLRDHGAVALGATPGRAWEQSRFHGPYLRDALLDRGVLVDTLETAAPWATLEAVHEAVRAALLAHAPVVGCHVSHLYATGASLYFTVLARRDDADALGQWRALKRDATDAVLASGGTLTHHHAVGTDHAPWLAREVGATGVAALRALKRELDPAGILNPGKLLAG